MSTWLWWLSVAFFGIGDLITTAVAVLHISISEGSPIVSWLLHTYGMFGLLVMKLISLALGYTVWCSISRPHNVGVPLAYSVLGVGLTTWNLFVIGFTLSG